MTEPPTPDLPVSTDWLPWSRPLGKRCRARLTAQESPTYFGRCELRPHDASMGHALERGMEIHRWVTEMSVESPDRVTWRGVPEPVPADPGTPFRPPSLGWPRTPWSAVEFEDRRRALADFNVDHATVTPMLTLPAEKVPDNWWTRRRFIRAYMGLRRISDDHIAAGHHVEFTAVNEGHIALHCHTCTPTRGTL